ncbi:MAG: tetratricopeptide repeat protein [Streptosporangiales bacterium]|nr:tetratricopeptide repeat protein [Streptosporangiales bacterium]
MAWSEVVWPRLASGGGGYVWSPGRHGETIRLPGAKHLKRAKRVEFRVLGPVELWADRRRYELGTPKERCLLAILLLNRGMPVSTEILIERLWDGRPLPTARDNLYGYIHHLRTRLRAATGERRIERRGGGGYLLDVPKECVDFYQFEWLREQAQAYADDGYNERALGVLHEGLALWRGEPLADLREDWAVGMRTTLRRRRDETIPLRMDLELKCGNHAAVVEELGELVARHPTNERLIRYRMLALQRCGRSAEALEVYITARRWLVEEHGHGPGHELNRLHRQILNDDPGLRHPTGPQRRPVPEPPNNLPREVDTFTGREENVQRLLALLAPEPGSGTPPVTVIVLHGPPGAGKTTLAVHLAARLTERHPDAQLFLDLYAHASDREAADAMETLDSALRLLGVPPDHIPGRLEDRVALWRTHLARRRCVIVLDDAADASQVRSLLPGSPGSVVLVTSRNRLAGLEGARPVPLDFMSEEDAGALFARTVGPDRPLDGEGLRTVVRLCDRLPLALTLAAGRLANREVWELSDLIATLSGEDRIGAIQAGDRTLEREFAMSYRDLTVPQATAFRRLGLHPGADFAAPSAAALTGLAPAEAGQAIEGLVDRNLVREISRGRYRYHDLLREYARELARREDGEDVLSDGLRGLLEHYIATATQACRTCHPFERHPELAAVPSPSAPSVNTPGQARAWLRAEHDNLVAAIRLGYERGPAESAALLARALWTYLEEAGHWAEAVDLHRHAAEVWRAVDEPAALADTLRVLAHAQWRLSALDEALNHAKEALALFREIGDKQGEALIMDRICSIHWGRSDYRTAIAYNHAAVEIFQKIGDSHGEATSLMHGAITLAERGRYPEAQADFEKALQIFRRIGDDRGLKWILNNLGDLAIRRGRPAAALARYEEAAAAVPELSRHDEALLLNNVGTVFARSGRLADALENYREALAIHQDIGDRIAETDTLLNIARAHVVAGDLVEGMAHYRRAQASSLELSDRRLRMRTLQGIGEIRLRSKEYAAALTAYLGCRELAREIDSAYEEACALEGIGNALLHLQGPDKARLSWEQALRTYTRLGVPEADELRGRLEGGGEAAGS